MRPVTPSSPRTLRIILTIHPVLISSGSDLYFNPYGPRNFNFSPFQVISHFRQLLWRQPQKPLKRLMGEKKSNDSRRTGVDQIASPGSKAPLLRLLTSYSRTPADLRKRRRDSRSQSLEMYTSHFLFVAGSLIRSEYLIDEASCVSFIFSQILNS